MRLSDIECPVCGAPLDFAEMHTSAITQDGTLTITVGLTIGAMDHLRGHVDPPDETS